LEDAGFPVVFLHGESLSHELWDRQAEAFAERYRFLSYDRRGHGQSEAPSRGYSPVDHAQDLSALMAHLGLPEAHFVVQSRGGAIILQFLRRSPEKVRSIVFADATIPLVELSPVFQAAARRYREPSPSLERALEQREARKQAPFYRVAQERADVRTILERMIDQHSPQIALNPDRANDLASRLDVGPWSDADFPDMVALAKPTLLLVGEHTDPFFTEGAKAAARLWPRTEYHMVAGTDHLLMLESPEEFNRLTLSFLANVDAEHSEAAAVFEEEVQGLWRYRTIVRAGGPEAEIHGLFLFHDGRFVQQSLNAGEPWDHQLAQAHAGTYRREGETLVLVSQVGLVVDPTREPAVENRRDARHEVTVRRSGDSLTLTFGTGTVQKLERVGPGTGRIVLLERGALALVDGVFLLAAETGTRAVGGSGAFEQRDGGLELRGESWFRIDDGKPTYSRGPTVQAVLEPDRLRLPSGLDIPVRR